LFISFSLAVYLLCPNSRKKGIVFFILGGGGAIMYLLARIWLPFSK
jgi:putative membrane protein